MFLETMVLYPPVVSVAGFANVDRGMFRAVGNITKLMDCCKHQVQLILFRSSLYIYLKICRKRRVPVRLDRCVYYTETVTHTSVRVLLLMGVQKISVPDTSQILLQRVLS
jgi:hypothetical protein